MKPEVNLTPIVQERWGPVLDAMLPGCIGEERRHRCGILYQRDRATAALGKASWEASLILRAVQSLGMVYAYASLPLDELAELNRQMVRLMSAATALHTRGPRSEGLA